MERSQTQYVLLGILAIHPNQSGYEIRKTIEQTVGFFWGESFGQIYPTLKRLVAEGLSPPAPREQARPRRQEYSITPAGARNTGTTGWQCLIAKILHATSSF